MAKEIFTLSKEEAVKYIKNSAKFIYNHAESLLGEYHKMTGAEIAIRFSVDELPTVNVKRNYIAAGYNEGFHDGENGNEVSKA